MEGEKEQQVLLAKHTSVHIFYTYEICMPGVSKNKVKIMEQKKY